MEVLVNLQIAGLNFIFGKAGPWHYGIPLLASQQIVVDNLLLRARSLSRLGGHVFSGCGSTVETTATELERLHVLFSDQSQDIPYGSPLGFQSKKSKGPSAVVVPTVASSVAFPDTLQGFNPLPFLDSNFAQAYHDPSVLLHGHSREAVRMMPPDAVSAATRAELLQLGKRWDQVGRLCLALPQEIDQQDRCGLFCISKNDGELRQIIDRRPRNSRELPPPQHGPKMGHPSTLLGIIIPHGFDLLGSVDDLKNFYHEFQVSHHRGLSTPVGPWWSVSEWEDSQALADLKLRHPRLKLKSSDTIFMCFKGLSMGDHWAPAFAQMAHENLLASHGALNPEEHLRFGEITPRAPLGHYSGVCIDDKLNLQITPKNCWDVPLRDSESCQQADTAYETAGLTHHPKKRLRRVPVCAAWGAQVEGVVGLIGAKRERLCLLSMATMLAASSSVLTRTLVEKILGFWTFCFQFRRCLFSLISTLYTIGAPGSKEDDPFRPTREARQELQLLSVLGPTALAQLRSQVSPKIYATDAAPGGAGAVSCFVGSAVSKELYRRAEVRGFHTKLLPPVSAYFQEKGMPVCPNIVSNDFCSEDSEPPARDSCQLPQEPRFVQPSECGVIKIRSPAVQAIAHKFWEFSPHVPPVDLAPGPHNDQLLNFRFDFIEIYSGCSRMTTAFADKGLVVGPPVDIKEGWDMMDEALVRFLLFLCMAGRVAILWLGPPRTTFSLAHRPKLRNRGQPLGFDLFNQDVIRGNYHMHLSICLWVAQKCAGRVALLETPWSALTRFLPAWLWCLSLGGADIRLDQCRFGTPYLKSTRLLSTHRHLQAMGRLCTCDHTHVKLEGSYAQAAAAYPFPMCEHVARIVVEGCEATQPCKLNPPDGVQHLDVPAGDPPPLRDCRTSQKFVSHLWATQLSESLPWKVCKKYKFLKGGHINVLECHARRSLLLNIPAQQRVVVLQDSMVTLGASAKGRSSSQSLNKVLKQECAICVAKDLYVGGIHSPTWALRADDPSRGRSVRLPRAPLPGWFLDLRAGRLAQAQDCLDDLSETPRSLGRWFLFAAAAFLASAADFNTVSDWTSSSSRPSKQGRLGARKSVGSNCSPETPAFCRFHRLDQDSISSSKAFGKFGKEHTHSSCGVAGGVRKSSVREGGEPSHFCRDNQCDPATVSFLEDDDDWPLAAGNYLGKLTPNASTSSDSETSPGSYGERRHFLEMASPGTLAFVGLLRFTSACRALLPDGQEFCHERADRFGQGCSRPVAPNQKQNSRCSFSKCSVGRAERDSFPAKVFKCHDSDRTSLAALASSFPT